MNLTLFKADLRGNAAFWVIVAYVMMMYFSIMSTMFDPTDTSALASMLELMPEGLIAMLVGMICFFYSCLFNTAKLSLSFSAGVNIAFLLLFMLGGVSSQSEPLKKLSIFSLLDTQRILEGSGTAGLDLMLIVVILVLFGLSVWVFDRKNLPI